MLPALPSPQPQSGTAPGRSQLWGDLRRQVQGLTLALLLLLAVGLTGCSRVPAPPRDTVLSALSLQIELTQQAIAQALDQPPGGKPEVSHVRIEEQRSVTIGSGRGLQLSGRFDWRLADDPTPTNSPFELFLQRGERGQSWRLARPTGQGAEARSQDWLIDPLPING